MSGSESMSQVDELIVLELGRALQFLNVALRAEEVRAQLCKAVGSIHSRGVNGGNAH